MDGLVLKIPNINGECKLDGYKDQITCLSYSHGVSMPISFDVSNAGRSRGRAEHQAFSVTKYMDKASPTLNFKCNVGANLGTVEFRVLRTDGAKGQAEMMVYKFEDTVLSSVSVSGGGGDTPVENLSFNYSKISWDYKVQGEDVKSPGNAAAEWDLSINKGS